MITVSKELSLKALPTPGRDNKSNGGNNNEKRNDYQNNS
jgi:hypothetical protein